VIGTLRSVLKQIKPVIEIKVKLNLQSGESYRT
jgi:hypothetical protein